MRWPDHTAAAQVRDAMVSGMDVFPTLLAAVGASSAGEVDGVNLWPVIQDAAAPAPHEALHWHYPHYHHLGRGPCGAIRAGDFKLIEWFGMPSRCELFNLARDPGETNDLAATDISRRDALWQDLRAWRNQVGAQEMSPNPAYDASALTQLLPPADDTSYPVS